ncbi:MAG: flavodoxin family protein [Proteobacteria bacterium]|nr:flavodoxin family protein [Pseudomonadota bacterium]MBU2260399.1 flavodoxin family protein [Pseudomonadota bacterium]
MKVVAFNGSARAQGNTAILLNLVLDEIQKEGIETELVSLAGKIIPGCQACYKCHKEMDGHCAVTGDIVNECIDKMRAADGILLGSPTYFSNITSGMKALIERSGMVARANNGLFKRKVGAGVVAVRRAGAIHTFSSLNFFFLIGQMIVVGSNYWNIGIGREPGAVAEDEEGMQTMTILGQNMAWLIKKING